MKKFKQYRRTSIAELRPITREEIEEGLYSHISISQADIDGGSPKAGDMIARNPENYDDQWLVAAQYFNDNFEEIQ
jgi:hypothetical protein